VVSQLIHPESNHPKCIEFLKFYSNHGLTQVVRSPTRGNKFLDLILTNDPLIVSSLSVGEPFSTSNHDSISLSIVPPVLKNKCNINSNAHSLSDATLRCKYYDYNSADWLSFAYFCSNVNCNLLFCTCVSANDFWIAFADFLHSGTDKFIPKKLSSVNKITNGLEVNVKKFIPKAIKNLQAKKNKLWIKSKTNPSVDCKNKYKKLALKIKNAHKGLISNQEKRIIESKNLDTLYNHVNARLVHKPE
jgi:hypothetical protein